MKLEGCRIHLAGSASTDCDESKLTYIHQLVRDLTATLMSEGACFILQFGREPRLRDREDGPSITFDWTIAEVLAEGIRSRKYASVVHGKKSILSIVTFKTDGQIPVERRALFEELKESGAVQLEFMEAGWTGGAVRRQMMAEAGDVFICISGGEGVEHLAGEYSSRGKPILPLDIQLGSSGEDGSGGAARLFDRALTKPGDFFRCKDKSEAGLLLDLTKTKQGEIEPEKVSGAIRKLIEKLENPRVFFVRLLNSSLEEFPHVDNFFRNAVSPFVEKIGFEPVQMGMGKNNFAWMNEAIFDSLHYASAILVDLTTLRPNCFMELGYAFGNKQRVIITAREGTNLPFDPYALETHFWTEKDQPNIQIEKLRVHWERNIDMPRLVKPKIAR